MSSQTFRAQGSPSTDEIEVRALYGQLLDGWNRRSAGDFAALFDEDGSSVGFDGGPLNGRAEIESSASKVMYPSASSVISATDP